MALAASSWLASCASATPASSPAAAPESPTAKFSPKSQWIATLATLGTADDMREYLRTGLRENELRRVGFDQVTIAECIERVVASALEDRSSRGALPARRRLTESLATYFDAVHEAMVRRSAGAASCLPHMR